MTVCNEERRQGFSAGASSYLLPKSLECCDGALAGGSLTTAQEPATDKEEKVAEAIHDGAGGRGLGNRQVEPGQGEDQSPDDETCAK